MLREWTNTKDSLCILGKNQSNLLEWCYTKTECGNFIMMGASPECFEVVILKRTNKGVVERPGGGYVPLLFVTIKDGYTMVKDATSKRLTTRDLNQEELVELIDSVPIGKEGKMCELFQ